MRSLVVVCAGLAAGLLHLGCSKAPREPAPGAAAPTGVDRGAATVGARAPTPPGPGATAPAAPEGAVPASGGSTEPDPSFHLATEQPAAVAAAAPATARLVVHPGPGLKMNLDFPTGLTLQPPAGVTLTKTAFAATEADAFDTKQLVYSVPMSAAAAGEYKVPGTFKFAVCDEGACYPKKRAVELLLTVK